MAFFLQPTLPSTFVTALLHLCFPGPLAADEDLATPGASKRTWKHPTGIVGYLLERKLVGDGVIDGGVTNYLARAGDWVGHFVRSTPDVVTDASGPQPNIHQALITMPDISEATTVALLKTLVSHHLATADAANRIDVDSTGLPFPPPSLATFLAGFVESPSTPAILREALQQQLSAVEALPVLEALDGWLGWWAKRGGGGGQTDADWKAEGRARPKRLPTNPFAPLSLDEVEEDVTPPRVEDVRVRFSGSVVVADTSCRSFPSCKRSSTRTSSLSSYNANPTPSSAVSQATSQRTSPSLRTCRPSSERCRYMLARGRSSSRRRVLRRCRRESSRGSERRWQRGWRPRRSMPRWESTL